LSSSVSKCCRSTANSSPPDGSAGDGAVCLRLPQVTVVLRCAKIGQPVERWFAQNKLPETQDTAASRQFTREVLDAAPNLGWPLPEPQYVHQDDAVVIARWLAHCRAEGRPAQLDTNSSSRVRVCLVVPLPAMQSAFQGRTEHLCSQRYSLHREVEPSQNTSEDQRIGSNH
jgi:hypothetical protein